MSKRNILCVAEHSAVEYMSPKTVQKCVKKHEFGMRITWSEGPKLHTEGERVQPIYFKHTIDL